MLRFAMRRPLWLRRLYTSPILQGRVVKEFKLADIGEGITECEVIKWSVHPNSKIMSFDPLCEVQSDKASVEITSPFDGTVKELLVKEGEVAKVGSNLCLLEVEEEDAKELDETAAPPPHLPQENERVDPSSSSSEPQPKEVSSASRRHHPLDPSRPSQSEFSKSDIDVLALPSVRHFAQENGVDIAQIAPGSGRNGRVEKRDVEAFMSSGSSNSTAVPLQQPTAGTSKDVTVELGRTRLAMFKAMTRSLEIPHLGYSTYLDLTRLDAFMSTINNSIPTHYLPEHDGKSQRPPLVSPASVCALPDSPSISPDARYTRLTFLPFLLKTLSASMIAWPLFRSSLAPHSDGAKPSLVTRPHADISVALSTPTGLYTPTLQSVNTMNVFDIAAQLKHLAHLGRQIPHQIPPPFMSKRGATISVSNIGAVGKGEFAAPLLVPGGGVAIVAIGRAKWIRDEELGGERRLRVGISWSADHRVVEGAEIAAFTEEWRSWVEHPEKTIAAGV